MPPSDRNEDGGAPALGHVAPALTHRWLGPIDVQPDRAYALAMTEDGALLLVSDDVVAPKGWLPGGGCEPGEEPVETLRRELEEEANATVRDHVFLGAAQLARAGTGASVHALYWARVEVAREFAAEHETTVRLLVDRDEFLDRLTWGRSDPTAAHLLQQAVDCDARMRRRDGVDPCRTPDDGSDGSGVG